MELLKSRQLFNPGLVALRKLGGNGSLKEIENQIVNDLQLPSPITDATHPGNPNRTELNYQLAWALTYLKNDGRIEKSGGGIWALTSLGALGGDVDPRELEARVRNKSAGVSPPPNDEGVLDWDDVDEQSETWKEELLQIIRSLSPKAFERLCQRVLRESGFEDVEVTGRPGDHGIDGQAVFRVANLISYRVFFQCKKYSADNTVGPSAVRDLRGATNGPLDRGLLITTSRFTKEAEREAREKSILIDTMNGTQLADRMRLLGLGGVETFSVKRGWFQQFESQ